MKCKKASCRISDVMPKGSSGIEGCESLLPRPPYSSAPVPLMSFIIGVYSSFGIYSTSLKLERSD